MRGMGLGSGMGAAALQALSLARPGLTLQLQLPPVQALWGRVFGK